MSLPRARCSTHAYLVRAPLPCKKCLPEGERKGGRMRFPGTRFLRMRCPSRPRESRDVGGGCRVGGLRGRLGGLGGAALPGRVQQRDAEPAEGAGRLPALRHADGGAAVRLLPRGRHLPLQLLPLGLHLRRGQLHPGRLFEDPNQPTEQGRIPGHLTRTSLCRFPVCQHHPPSRCHQLRGLTKRSRICHVPKPYVNQHATHNRL